MKLCQLWNQFGENSSGNPLQTIVSELRSVLTELENGDFQSRWETAKQIPEFGQPAIAFLVDLLYNNADDPELQWFVVRILGQFNHTDAVMALAQLLQETDDDVAEMAAQMLAQIGPQSVDALAVLIESSPSRVLVVSALSQMQDAVIVPLLLKVVADVEVSVRLKVMETLSRFHDPQIIPTLLQGLADLSAKVRQAAIAGISYRADLFQEHHHDPVALIQPFLNDLNVQVCQAAALALGRLGTNAATQALCTTASAKNVPIPLKLTIVQALGQISNDQSVQVLQKLWPRANSSLQVVDDEDQTLAEAIVKALALNRQADRSTQALIYCLHHQPTSDPALKKTIASALGQLADLQAIPELLQLLGTPDRGVRLHAIAALKQIAPDYAYSKLQVLAEDPNVEQDVRDGIAIALQEW